MCGKTLRLIVSVLALITISTGPARAFDRNDPALVGYWPFNEGSGTTAADLSQNGHDGALNGGVTWTAGKYGSALHFDGSGGYAGTGQSILNDAAGFTLAGWVSASNVDVYSSLFGQNDLVEFGFIGGSQLGTWLLGNNWQLVAADYPFDYPSWHHVALTGDASGVAIYIDGLEAARDAGPVSAGASGFTFNIGANVFNATGDPFFGEIDDVWVFNRALTAQEMPVLMQGSGGYPYASSPSPADGATHPDTWVTLSWRPGDFAVSHDVYLGDNFDDVNNGAGDTFRGNQESTFYVTGFPGFAYPDGLVPGTTYYWRIDEVNDAEPNSPWTGDVWSFFIPPRKAYNPNPTDGAAFVAADVTLTWTPGFGTKLHTVYFGNDFDTVNNVAGGLPQAPARYKPAALEFGSTYYWRVDEFDGVTTRRGDVWSFSTTLTGLGSAIAERWENIAGTDLNALKSDPRYPNNPDITEAVTQFAWNGPDADNYGGRIHGWLYAPATGEYTFWLNSDDNGQLWLSTDDDSSNVRLIAQESTYTGLNTWAAGEEQSAPIHLVGGEKYYIMALWKEGTGDDHCQVAWQGPGVPERVIIPGTNLSPYEPLNAYGARPGNGATGVTQTPILQWKPGLQAASHEVYFGTDADALKNATQSSPEYKGSKQLGDESYDPGKLAWETTYYWRVDEVNAVNPDGPWVGNVWSFTTADFLIVDDFEGYTDDDAANQAIWQSWIDGFGAADNGSQVGYVLPPYAEQTIVHGGRQSMPLLYDNTAGVTNSEAELKLTNVRDWTEGGVAELSLWFRGNPASVGSFVEGPAGTYTMTAAGADIWNQADEFHFAYKTLTGVGSIEAKVESVERTDNWAKAGVMIRESLDPGSKFAAVYVTPTTAGGTATNGCRFQARLDTGAAAVSDDAVASAQQTAIIAPYWIRLERDLGGNFRGYYSSDGTAWQAMTWNPQNIAMAGNAYVGLALTSHNNNVTCQAQFSNVRIAGTADPQWVNRDIGIASNAPEPLYVAISSPGAAQPSVVAHSDANAATIDTWTQWIVPLSAFSAQGVNLTNVETITIGLGAKAGMATADGSGRMYFDDIRLYRPADVP